MYQFPQKLITEMKECCFIMVSNLDKKTMLNIQACKCEGAHKLCDEYGLLERVIPTHFPIRNQYSNEKKLKMLKLQQL